MADYERLADAVRARQLAARSEAEAKKTWEHKVHAFFKSIERQLGFEISKANLSLSKRGFPIFHGFSASHEIIEFSYGAPRRCRVSLRWSESNRISCVVVELIAGTIPLLMEYELEPDGSGVKASSCNFMGTRTRRVESSPSQIATAIVAGVVHDHFS